MTPAQKKAVVAMLLTAADGQREREREREREKERKRDLLKLAVADSDNNLPAVVWLDVDGLGCFARLRHLAHRLQVQLAVARKILNLDSLVVKKHLDSCRGGAGV